MGTEYLIIQPGNTLDDQLRRDRLTCYRISKVSRQLRGNKAEVCEFLPFKGEFPILHPLEKTGFNNTAKPYLYFDDCLDSTKEKIREAEKYLYFERLFIAYLEKQNITPEMFKNYEEKHRQLIIDDWQKSDRIPDWLLD